MDSASRQHSAIMRTVSSQYGLQYAAGQLRTGLNWVGTLRTLSGQHDTVGAVENSIGDIADFRTSRPGVLLPTRYLGWIVWLAEYIRTIMDYENYRDLVNCAANLITIQLTSSICVATMTGLPARLHFEIIIF